MYLFVYWFIFSQQLQSPQLAYDSASVHFHLWPGTCLQAWRSLQPSGFCHVWVHSTVALDGTGSHTEETGSDRKEKRKRIGQWNIPLISVLYFFSPLSKTLHRTDLPLECPGIFMEECVWCGFCAISNSVGYIQFSCAPTSLSRCVLVASEAKTSSSQRRGLWSLFVLLSSCESTRKFG